MADAACRGLATGEQDVWHPGDRRSAKTTLDYAVARRVCQGCPVRLECALTGLELLPLTGVMGMWGGLTPPELAELARTLEEPGRKVAQHGSRACYVAGCRCPDCRRANAAGEHQRRFPDGGPLPCAGTRLGGGACGHPARPGSRYCPRHAGQDLAS
jgi:hypothetical protein